MDNQEEPLVSIIIPVYNIAPYVRDCIESVRNQTYHNIEIIIVDDGSTDGSGELCEEFAVQDERIRVIHQQNAGVVSARGKGMNASRGTYLSFIDGDDWIEPGMIENMVNDMGESDLISTKIWWEMKPNKWVEDFDRFPEGRYSGKAGLETIFKKMIYDTGTERIQSLTPGTCNKLFVSDLAKKVYKELNPQITFAEDTVFLYKYILNCNSIVISHKSFYHYRYREHSAAHRADKCRLININRVYLALEEDFRRHPLKDCLIFQLQRWIMHMTCRAINEFMGFESRVYIQEYIFDTFDLVGKRIILYGAGAAGRNAYRQLKKFGYKIVLWADKNYVSYQRLGMPVVSPDEIVSQKYDVLFIAVAERSLAEAIEEELAGKGIERERLLFREPKSFF